MRLLVLLIAAPMFASEPVGCPGSEPLATFRLSVRPFSRGAPLPLKEVGEISAGSHIIWHPVHLMPQASSGAEITIVAVPASDGHLLTMEPRKAAASADWQLLERPQVIAIIFGPQGLNEGKIQSLATHDRELLRELADYAEQSSQVESLVQRLADAEQSGSADSLLKGFSSQYGVAAPKLDTKASSDQQAALLLKAVLPATSAYDPLATRNVQVQQSGGLSATVAGMFFGNPVAMAAGGAALFQNLKSTMFPTTEFRSAFAHAVGGNRLTLCTKNVAPKSKTRIAYLWAYRVPEHRKPALSIEGPTHLPVGSKSKVGLKLGAGSTAIDLEYARDWQLLPISGGTPIPVGADHVSADSIELDLSKTHAPPGEYRVAASWDWSSLPVSGTLHLAPYGDLTHVRLAPGERDKLVEGNGTVAVKLTGADFEFLEKATLESSVPSAKKFEEKITLPSGSRHGPQNSATVDVDTSEPGSYQLLLTQSDGVEHELPITVLPPNPKLSNVPVRVNLAEAHESIRFEGTGTERIEAVSSAAGAFIGLADAHGWSGEITPAAGLVKGQLLSVVLKVQGLDKPLTVPDAIEIVGPRPRIRSAQKSLTGALGIDIRIDELPAGTSAGVVLTVDHLREGARPRLQLGCETGELRRSLTLSPDEPSGGAALAFAGPEELYLSVDPGAVGYAGCRITATVILDQEGRSDRFVLGRVIRIPHLERFTLTTEKIGDSSYAGILEGRDLDVIAKTGWDARNGTAVESIPTPASGDPARQSLRVVLPWPAPAPHAPLYVWLRGEAVGRKTAVVY